MSKQTVFLVDDDDSVRAAVRLILESAGHSVVSFPSAQEFLDQYDPTQAGCLVSDVRMPRMNGMELLRCLAKQGASIPVLMLSAHGDISMAVDAMKTGAVDFLEKPIEANLLREKVAHALAKDEQSRLVDEECREIKQFLLTLTAREREVLALIVEGKNAKTIAKVLGTSHNTVRVQRASIMRKMQADTDADIVRMMSSIGLLND